MYLVVGATGPVGLGGTICRLLRDRGEPVRALVRPTASPTRVAELRRMGVDLVEGDLKNRASLDGACHDTRAVVSTASVMVSRQAGDSVETVEPSSTSATRARRSGGAGGTRLAGSRSTTWRASPSRPSATTAPGTQCSSSAARRLSVLLRWYTSSRAWAAGLSGYGTSRSRSSRRRRRPLGTRSSGRPPACAAVTLRATWWTCARRWLHFQRA